MSEEFDLDLDEEFDIDLVQEFYNKYHAANGRFTNKLQAVKGKRGMAIRRAATRKVKAAARARKKAEMMQKMQPNKDKSEPLKGQFKPSGNKKMDAIAITRLDRGSPERAAAAKAFQKAYGD